MTPAGPEDEVPVVAITVLTEEPTEGQSSPKKPRGTARWLRFLEYLITGVATWYASYRIQSLSSPALWMPYEYKMVLLTLAPMFCSLVVFALLRALLQRMRSYFANSQQQGISDATADDEDQPDKGWFRIVSLTLALLFAGLCITSVIGFFNIRARSVISFQTDVDLRGEFTETSIPFFLDLERSQILVPEEWSPDTKTYFRQIEQRRLVSDGLQFVLTEAPYEIVKRLQGGPDKVQLDRTVNHFLYRYGLILLWLTCVLACAIVPWEFSVELAAESIWETLRPR